MKKYFFIILLVLSIPLLLGLCAAQSFKYNNLKRDVAKIENSQMEWVESNKQLIGEIAKLTSPERIARYAKNILGLQKIRPDDVLQIQIIGEGKGHGL